MLKTDDDSGQAHAIELNAAPEEPLRVCVRQALERYFADLDGHPPCGLHTMVMREVEEPLLRSVLSYVGGNQTRAAEILGMNRSTLRKRLKEYGLEGF